MKWPNFRKLIGQDLSGSHWWTYVAAILAALLLPVLLLVVALMIQPLVQPGTELLTDQFNGQLARLSISETLLTTGQASSPFVLVGLGAFVALALALLHHWANRLAGGLSRQLEHQLQRRIQRKTMQLGPVDLLGGRRSQPESLFTVDTAKVQQTAELWWEVCPTASSLLAVLLLVALWINVWITLTAILMGIVIWRIYRFLRRSASASADHWQRQADEEHQQLIEHLLVVPTLANGIPSETRAKGFDERLAQYRDAAAHLVDQSSAARPWLMLLLLIGGLLWLLVAGLAEGVTATGIAMIGFSLVSAVFPAARLVRLVRSLGPAERAATNILAFLNQEPHVREVPRPATLERLAQKIDLDHVTLADGNGQRLLDDVTLEIPSGARVGFMSLDDRSCIALAGLLARFFDPAAGRINFDGQDIREVRLGSVREQIAWVSPTGTLFSGTVAENITCGDTGFTNLQVNDAAKLTQSFGFVQRLPHGFSTEVGAIQHLLKPSQSFRLGLARSVLRNPGVMLIQEPELLDDETAAELDDALAQVARNRTLIILPSRITTLRSLEQVYLLQKGRLEASGTHTELLQSSELYRHLIYERFNPYRD